MLKAAPASWVNLPRVLRILQNWTCKGVVTKCKATIWWKWLWDVVDLIKDVMVCLLRMSWNELLFWNIPTRILDIVFVLNSSVRLSDHLECLSVCLFDRCLLLKVMIVFLEGVMSRHAGGLNVDTMDENMQIPAALSFCSAFTKQKIVFCKVFY